MVLRWTLVAADDCPVRFRTLWGRLSSAAYLSCGTNVVPFSGMAMNLRLSEGEAEALRQKAAQEGRSMQEVAREAIAEYVSDRPGRLRAAIERVRTEDAELLDRLSR